MPGTRALTPVGSRVGVSSWMTAEALSQGESSWSIAVSETPRADATSRKDDRWIGVPSRVRQTRDSIVGYHLPSFRVCSRHDHALFASFSAELAASIPLDRDYESGRIDRNLGAIGLFLAVVQARQYGVSIQRQLVELSHTRARSREQVASAGGALMAGHLGIEHSPAHYFGVEETVIGLTGILRPT